MGTGFVTVALIVDRCLKLFAGPLYVLTEYAPHGNLRDFLRSHRPAPNDQYEMPYFSDYRKTVNTVSMVAPGSIVLTNPRNDDFKHLTLNDLLSYSYQVARGMDFITAKLVRGSNHWLSAMYGVMFCLSVTWWQDQTRLSGCSVSALSIYHLHHT